MTTPNTRRFLSRIIKPMLLFVGLMLLTMVGFYFLEGWGPLNGYYAFIRTAFGDWFDQIAPRTDAGKIFATFLNILAILASGYFFATLSALFIEGELKNILKFKKMNKEIAKLNQHFIICGINDVSEHVIAEFIKTETPFVVVDKHPPAIEELQKEHSFLYIQEDPTSDDSLNAAGIKDARGLIAALKNDHENLFLVLSARTLNPKLRIATTALELESRPKLIKAGADEIISPNHIGGLRIASVMIRPSVVTFLDTMLRGNSTLRFDEVELKAGSKLVGKKFIEAQKAEESGINVVAIKKQGASDYICNHRADVTMEAGDILVALADPAQKEAFQKQYN